MTASGCGTMAKDYGHLLAHDPIYAAKAKRISDLTKDIAEILPTLQQELVDLIGADQKPGVVYHPPCTLQHGQQIRGKVEGLLSSLGIGVRLCNIVILAVVQRAPTPLLNPSSQNNSARTNLVT